MIIVWLGYYHLLELKDKQSSWVYIHNRRRAAIGGQTYNSTSGVMIVLLQLQIIFCPGSGLPAHLDLHIKATTVDRDLFGIQ